MKITVWMRIIPYLIDWYNSRAWDPYRFFPPIVALTVQLASLPFQKSLTAEHDRRLSEVGILDSAQRTLFLRIAKDWDLRTSYFATAITSFFSIASITRAFSGGGAFFAILVSLLFLLSLIIYPKVFQGPLGRVSTPLTEAGAKSKLQLWMSKRKLSYADFYSYVLRLTNILLLFTILVTMPEKSSK